MCKPSSSFNIKPSFHMVVTGRWVSLTVFCSQWSIWLVRNQCKSLAVFQGRWRSFRVVDGLSGSLTVFQGRWRSFMVVNGLWKSSFKLLFLAPNLLTVSRWWSFRVVGGRQMYFVLFSYDTNQTTWSLAVFHLESIPATQSLTVFEGHYWSLQNFHSCFHRVAHSFWGNFKFNNHRERPLTTIWKPG